MLICNKQPAILIIHCGDNTIGAPQNTPLDKRYWKIHELTELLPNTLIVWSHIYLGVIGGSPYQPLKVKTLGVE